MKAKIFSFVVIISYLGVTWLYRSYEVGISIDKLIFSFELTILPLYVLVLIFIFLDARILRKKILVPNLVLSHIVFTICYALLVLIVLPAYSYDTLLISKQDAKVKLLEAYEHAEDVGDVEEMEAYITYYHNNIESFNPINFTKNFFPSVPERENRIAKNTNAREQDFYSSLISSDNIRHLNRSDILFRIKNYIEDKQFVSGRALIGYYRGIYGNDRDIIFLSDLLENNYQRIDEKGNIIIDYEAQNYYQQLGYFYYLIEKKDVGRDSLLLGYYILNAFLNNAQLDQQEEILWIQDQILEKLNQKVFFVSDARINLFHFGIKKKVVFIVQGDDDLIIWSADDIEHVADTKIAYLEDLELIALSRTTKEILWYITIPYAKLEGERLYTFSVEKIALDVQYHAELQYVADEDTTKLPVFLETGVQDNIGMSVDQMDNLKPSYTFINNRNILQLISLIGVWMEYHLPMNILFENLYQQLLLVSLFLIFGLFVLRVFVQISYSNISFKAGEKNILFCTLGYIPMYILFESIGVFAIRISVLMFGIMLLLGTLAIILIIAFVEIRNMNLIVQKYTDDLEELKAKRGLMQRS